MSAVDIVMENETILLVLAGIFLVLFGMWFGYILRRWSWLPRKRQRRCFNDAPVPYMAPRQSRRGETVEICGATWYRMN